MQCTINPPSGIMNEQQQQRTEMHLYTKPNESSTHGTRNQRKRTAQWRSVPEERSFFFSIEFIRGSQQSCKASPRFIRFFFVFAKKLRIYYYHLNFIFFLYLRLKKICLFMLYIRLLKSVHILPGKGRKTHTHTHFDIFIFFFRSSNIPECRCCAYKTKLSLRHLKHTRCSK